MKPDCPSQSVRAVDLQLDVPSGRWHTAVREFRQHLRETLGTQAFYAAGLALQKGLPYFIIPLLLRLYGDRIYASYVLFYSTTLMFSNVLALAMPNSVIVFWHAEQDKQGLASTYFGLLGLTQAGMSALLALPLFIIYRRSFGNDQALLFTLCALVFAALYNLNTFLTGVCRARCYSKSYFNAQLIAALTVIGAVIGLRRWPRVEALILAFMLSLMAQNLGLFGVIREYLGKVIHHFDRRLARRILLYSLPLVPHIGATLFYYWIDKYLVRQFFPAPQFSEFVITFQYASMQVFFSQVFALHTFPLVCRLVADGEDAKMRSVVRTYNILLVGLGAAWMAALLLLEWIGAPLRLNTAGVLLLGIAFMLWNIASNYVNVLWARFRTAAVTVVSIAAGVILLVVLLVGSGLRNINVCYFAHLACAASATCAFAALDRHYGRIRARASVPPVQTPYMMD